MLAVNPNLKFTHPSLLNDPVKAVGFGRQNPQPPQLSTSPDAAIERLIQGNQKFVETRGQTQQNSIRLSAVAQGQKPFAAVLNYAQTTTSTEELFGQKFGELFAIDAPGQRPNSQAISGIEYSVLIHGITAVMVLGEATNLAAQPDTSVKRMKVAIEHNKIFVSGRTPQTQAEAEIAAKTNILDRVAKLKTAPLLARLIQAGDLKIVGGLYDATQGTVTIVG
jgi:carbonic anhydrase